MKILHLVHQYAPDYVGGTELYTAKLAAEQVKRGHKVAIFVPAPRPCPTDRSPLQQTTETGVSIYRVCVGQRSASQVFTDTIRGSALIMDALQETLSTFQPDIVHIQHLMGLPSEIGSLLTNAQIPYIVTLHDYWYGCANAQLLTNYDETVCDGPNRFFSNCGRCASARAGFTTGGRLLGGAVAPLLAYRQHRLRSVLQNAKVVIPPTRFVQQIYEEIGFSSANFIHVPHGIELPESLIQTAKAEAPQQRAARPEKLVVTYIGGIAPQKGLHTLIQAFNRLPDDASLTIYGDLTKFPDYVAQLHDSIAHPNITLAGRLAHDQIWGAMATADVVAIPTHWYEASPLIIDEVFAAGSPLLASRLGAMSEKIRHNVDGWLVTPSDSAAWEVGLKIFYDDRGLSGRLRGNIQPRFTLEAHVSRVLALYEEDKGAKAGR